MSDNPTSIFLECFNLVLKSFASVLEALKVDLFKVGLVSITFWDLILGFLVVGLVFGFFLAPRSGSGIQAFSNENKKANAEHFRKEKLKAIERQKSMERKGKK